MDLKAKIIHGWDISAKGYSENVVVDDFVEPGKTIWTDLITSIAPNQGPLKILDVGTGPGVFATILTLAGHEVTGIDISTAMLDEARKNSAKYGVSPDYQIMDSENLTFPENTFDMIISRNVVWIMEKPEEAYASWLKCLKPGGRIVVFDTAHGKKNFLTSFDEDTTKFVEDYKAKFGKEPPLSFEPHRYEEARGWKRELKLSFEARPEWDIETLTRLGYENIRWDNVTKETSYTQELIYQNADQVYFRLQADKPTA